MAKYGKGKIFMRILSMFMENPQEFRIEPDNHKSGNGENKKWICTVK